CGASLKITESVDIVTELSDIADETATKIEFISNDFEEGQQLMTAFGGIAAMLRYRSGI
ncbi:MAG: peptide chain release factor 1, partial [Spirochaetes bacterium]|nr:peptide chain release factor 1 [Spirochaetota bacterium]